MFILTYIFLINYRSITCNFKIINGTENIFSPIFVKK